jgi:hypothetical protein
MEMVNGPMGVPFGRLDWQSNFSSPSEMDDGLTVGSTRLEKYFFSSKEMVIGPTVGCGSI